MCQQAEIRYILLTLLWAEEYLVSYQFSVSDPYLRSEHYEKVILV